LQRVAKLRGKNEMDKRTTLSLIKADMGMSAIPVHTEN